MKKARYLFLILLMTLTCISAVAQQRNVLQVPDITTHIGNVQIPVVIENTDQIVGVQFDITLPESVTAESAGTLSNRSDGHIVTISRLNSGFYRVLLYSTQNRPLLGQSGIVMYLSVTIPATFEEGSKHALSITNAVLGKATGENVLTETIAGSISISKLPDLTVNNIACDQQSLNPGDRILVSWQVENIGEQATNGGWSEQVSLVSEDGTENKLIATTHYDNIIEASGIVSRKVEISLPFLLGIDGNARLQVRIVPDNNTGESMSAQGNNTLTGKNTLAVTKVLIVELLPKRIEENSGKYVALRVNRSGCWNNSETFAITTKADARVSVPSTITIPANQSGAVVYFNVNDNDILDNDSVVKISVEGNGYKGITSSLIIEDNELPKLSLSVSKTETDEGDTLQLTVTTSRVSGSPIVVSLNSEKAHRFTFPQQVVIPVGDISVTVDVIVVDNDEIELPESIVFRASAQKHESGECSLLLKDNDIQTFTLSISPETISESDGYAAIFGVIKRTDNFDKRVTLKLSDDSNGLLYYSDQTVVMAKNQTEVQFNIGVTDNDLVDGNHIVNVTATVYASSCDCTMSGNNTGSMTTTVTIIDDDGPSLKIKPAGTAMLEGSEENLFVISHNIKSDTDVKVRISSDKDNLLEYDHELTIPANQTSANLLVKVNNNDQQDDSNIVAFLVEADGYAQGTCWILITDQTLPDAIITLYADKTEVEAEQTVMLRAVVKNVGNSSMYSTTPVEISFSGKSESEKLTIGKTVAVGDSAEVEFNYKIPAITGDHTFEAIVNADGKVPELIYANNSSEKVNISVISPFNLTAQTDKDIYKQTDSIYISGKAIGSAGRNAKIEVYIINENIRQTITTFTDEDGNYSTAWKPTGKQSGHFIIGACYPDSKVTDEMDVFDIYGVRANDNFTTCELSRTETISGKIVITNPGNLIQSGLEVIPKAVSVNCKFVFNVPNTIGAGESVEIVYTVTANEISEGKDWQQMPVVITTAEGAYLEYIIYYFVHPLKAKLQTDKTSINTTMTYGTPREYPVTIRNIGKEETGKISLALPDWIQAITPSNMASLAQGDSATILLRFIPTAAMKLNVGVSGNIGINCANGDGTSISFFLTPVSEEIGKLKVDVVDEYTFFTEEAPHVSKARVVLKNPSTNEVVVEGETTEDGVFTAEIPEGYYSITINADKHDSYTNTVIVDPGVEKEIEAFLSYQAITYEWEVVETSVEDEYEIKTIVRYETRVPKPVVIITLPEEQPEPNSIIPVIITNKGLVNAVDVNMSLYLNNGYKLEFLNAPSLDILAPQQSHVFYVRMIPDVDKEEINGKARRSSKKCYTLIARARYKELCQKYTGDQLSEAIKKWGDRHCATSGSGGSAGSSGSGGGPGSPGGSVNSSYGGYYKIWDTDNPAKFCDKKPSNNDGNNGYGEGNDNNPPFVPETTPDENEKCDDVPVLNYLLISNDGYRHKMLGVAADGVSQVMIVFDKDSHIPPENCGWSCYWSLEDDNGQIGSLDNKESWDKVVYTAPEDFFESNKNRFTIIAKIVYTNGEKAFEKKIPIIISRVPVVMVHGLNSDPSCWHTNYIDISPGKGMVEYLINSKNYTHNQLFTVDYEAHHNDSFETNRDIVGETVKTFLESTKQSQIVTSKVDAICHSMGGLLTKKYIQNNNGSMFHKIITINTPHEGSQLGDFMTDRRVQFVRDIEDIVDWVLMPMPVPTLMPINRTPYPIARSVLKMLYNKFAPSNTDINHGAVADLSVEREAIKIIDNNSTKDVKCHAIVTSTNNIEGMLDWMLNGFFDAFGYADNATFLNELFREDSSDMIVPTHSQQGGLLGNNITNRNGDINFCHIRTCRNNIIKNRVLELLTESMNSPVFSNGFKSTGGLHYQMNRLDTVYKIYTPQNIANPEIHPDFNANNNSPKKSPSIDNESDENSYLTLNIGYQIGDTLIKVSVNSVGTFTDIQFGSLYNNIPLEIVKSSAGVLHLPQKTIGEIIIMYEGKSEKGNWFYATDTISINTIGEKVIEKIEFVSDSLFVYGSNQLKPYMICLWSDGTYTNLQDAILSVKDETIAKIDNGRIFGQKTGETTITASYNGSTSSVPLKVFVYNSYNNSEGNEDSDDSPSICSTVTLSFKQKNVMTRQAFRGTLTINNGHETTAMKDVKMNLEVRDMDGNLTTSHEFQIDAESLDGFTGDLDFTSGWTLAENGTGVATFLFIPTKYAAPTEPKDYSFGGSFSYTDPYTGYTVTRDLNPVTLTVNPSPNLEMTYFMQRDVFGDDPLTEAVEPMIPSEFALIVNNKGYGDAENMNLTTHQPEIIDNQKGLAITFELISTQLNGSDKNLSLGGSMVNDFGTILAHSQAYAQWWLQSSLLGHFIEYDVKATHLTSRNNPDLSLLDTVTIHELIHGFTVRKDTDKPLRGFLVNDIKDKNDMPDEVYFTDATRQEAFIATDASVTKQTDTEFVLNVNVGNSGWNYGSLLDPTYGKQKLVKIVRSDGTEIDLDNIWQTDRTLRDGKDPLYENRLHFVGNMPIGGETFNLTFEPKPNIELEVEKYAGVPEEGTVLKERLNVITVQFNKPIKMETFTSEDITLTCQGVQLDVSPIIIEQVNESEYKLKLNEVTLLDGYYVLTVQTSGIEDYEGFFGSIGKQVAWIQFVDGKVALKVTASPAEGGTVTPAGGRFDYDSDVTLKTTATEGYDFTGWTENGETVSTDNEFTYHVSTDSEIKAQFSVKHFNVNIDYDPSQGVIDGGATGIYNYGTQLHLKAIPINGYEFDAWKVGNDVVSESALYTITINRDMNIKANFDLSLPKLTLDLHQGWNWVSSNLSEPTLLNSKQFLNPIAEVTDRFVGILDELINDPVYGLTGGLTTINPTEGYKLHVLENITHTWKGTSSNPATTPVNLHNGWNWIGYVPLTSTSLTNAFSDLKASEGDIVRSMDDFSTYTGTEWLGTLYKMNPGEGYMYYAGNTTSFNYPSINVSSAQTNKARVEVANGYPWNYDTHKYPDNTTLIGLLYTNGKLTPIEAYTVGAFCDNECRGIGKYAAGKLFLTIHGRIANSEKIYFRAHENATGREYNISEDIFFNGQQEGSYSVPFSLNITNEAVSTKEVLAGHYTIYPRPLHNRLYIHGETADIKTVQIMSINGATSIMQTGYEDMGIDVSGLPSGVYVVTVLQNNGKMYFDKVIKVHN